MDRLTEVINRINELIPGKLKFENGELTWYHEDDSEDADDNLWDDYCRAADIIRREIPGCEITGQWQDNDSAGFDVKQFQI